jgi:SAM-dependent methyltransferase
MGPGSASRFTDESYWDEYWRRHVAELPAVVARRPRTLQVNAILDVLEAHLERDPRTVALEIGGSPGRYLAYLHGRFGYRCALLDFSPVGCALARRNFELLGIPVDVHESDLFDPGLEIGSFDLVYSLGLIEHFEDLEGVAAAHARLVRPGGTLVLGVPNVLGVNHWFMKRLAPRRLSTHNTDAMLLEHWDEFEANLQLERRFRGFVGGFEPSVFSVIEERTPANLPIWALAQLLERTVGHRFARLRRFNHPKLSGYLLGVWRVPMPPPQGPGSISGG